MIQKILPGVYRLTFGQPEAFTFETFREYPMKAWGADHPLPFDEQEIQFAVNRRGCVLTLPQLGEVYGLGLQLTTFKHTMGRRLMRCNADPVSTDGQSHAPVPFFVTTAGYGVLVDSARDVCFYLGQVKEKGASAREMKKDIPWEPGMTDAAYNGKAAVAMRTRIEIPLSQGVDVYIFAGENLLDAVQKYNMFSGGGAKMPKWGLGVWYRMYGNSTAQEWVDMAQRFRNDRLKISVLGLEPGWQTHAYSCSFVYNDARLGDRKGALNAMHEMGYHINLWEHCYTHPTSPIYEELLPYSGDCEVWSGIVPDFAMREARDIFLKQQKTLGADCFKLDECDGGDLTGGWSFPDGAAFPSGLDGEQMRHLMGLLYQQTMNEAFPDACHSVRASGALASPYPFVLYSDLYKHEDFVRGVVNAGFSGLNWAPEVRHAVSLKDFVRRLQTAVFSPQTLINAWYLKNPPWDQLNRALNEICVRMEEADEALRLVRDLFEVRDALVPYLERMYLQYHESGKPVFRALVMDWPEDEQCLNIDDEYLMGDDYLFAPLTAKSDVRRVYLPEGKWMRGKQEYSAGWHEFECAMDEYLLFEKVK